MVYHFQCGLCDTDYVGYTKRHLHQCKEEHISSTIGKHVKEHNDNSVDFVDCFDVLKKCRSKFDCLVYEMLFIRKIKPSLNKQSDSVRAKVFV